MIKRAIFILLSTVLTACQNLPGQQNKFDITFLRTNLVPGVTTSSDVRNIFGNPDYTSNGSDGGTYWSYSEQIKHLPKT